MYFSLHTHARTKHTLVSLTGKLASYTGIAHTICLGRVLDVGIVLFSEESWVGRQFPWDHVATPQPARGM